MKDWTTLTPDKTKLLRKNYTSGRSGYSVDRVVLHHNAGTLTTEQCYSVWQTREASAHFQVEKDGTIGQLVKLSDTAWHAGNWVANCKSIGIEHANNTGSSGGWTISDDTLDNGAHLVAAICSYYGLGKPAYGKNVFYHSTYASTSCPGGIAGSQRADYLAKAQSYYASMTGSSSSSSSSSASVFNLDEDGYWGKEVTKALQTYYGTTVDGVVSSQSSYWKSQNPGLTGGWEWVSATSAVGSQLVMAIQKALGVTVDGLIGPTTIKALQKKLGTTQDGVFSKKSSAILKLQSNLNTLGRPW